MFSLEPLGRDGALAAQPFDKFLVAVPHRRIESGKTIVTNPVQIGAATEKMVGRYELASMAGTPKGVGNDIW